MNQQRLNQSNKFSACITDIEISKKRAQGAGEDKVVMKEILHNKDEKTLVEIISKDAHVIFKGSTLQINGTKPHIVQDSDCQS